MKHGDSLYATRGVYVSGQHKEPYYIDHATHVKGVKTTKAVVADFTDLDVSIYDPVINIISVEQSELEIINYTTYTEPLQPDPVINILSIDVGDVELIQYQTINEALNADPVINILSIDVGDVELIQYQTENYDSNKEYMICVTSISTTKAAITNESS